MKAVVLIRGINVGGIVLKMDTLKQILRACGFEDVQTYIQSGNAIVQSRLQTTKDIEEAVQVMITREAGLDLAVIVKEGEAYLLETYSHPFGETADEKNIYLTFLKSKPNFDPSELLESLNSDKEQFVLVGDLLFGYYGAGYGKSKYTTTYFEKKLGVAATTRNLNTAKKLGAMLKD